MQTIVKYALTREGDGASRDMFRCVPFTKTTRTPFSDQIVIIVQNGLLTMRYKITNGSSVAIVPPTAHNVETRL